MVSNCGDGCGGCMFWWSRRGIVCEGGHLLNGMVQERLCPDVEVQHLRKLGYPDEEVCGCPNMKGT